MFGKLKRTICGRIGLKLALGATFLPVATMLFFGWRLVESERAALHETYSGRAGTLARVTASALREPAALGDWDVIEEFLETTVKSESEVAFAYVQRSSDDKVIAERGTHGVAEHILHGSGALAGRFVVRRGAIKIDAQNLGWVVVGLSLEGPEAILATRARTVVASAVGIGLLTAVLLMLVLRHQVVRPMAQLAEFVGHIGKGDYERSLVLQRTDELGRLSQALDHMRQEQRQILALLRGQHEQQLRTLGQLTAALQQSRAAELAKGRFLATVSHEVRTPLNGILGLTGLLGMTKLDSEQADFVATLDRSAQGLVGILNNVLDFSTLNSDEVELQPTTARLRSELDEVIQLALACADKKTLASRLTIAPDVPESVTCDIQRLRQVVWNIMNNAVKYSTQGEIRARVALDRPPVKGSRELVLRFEIEDEGVGIPADALERIFEPFSQVDDSDSRAYGGTGLGLAITKQLVELMGGSVGVHSELGRGSTFWFTVQVERSRDASRTAGRAGVAKVLADMAALAARSNQGAAPSEADTAPGVLAPLPTSARPIVLVAEDNPVNQLLVRRLLEKLGVDVIVAEDGVVAVEQFEAVRPRLVLMDCQMPRLDGFGATRQIRAIEDAQGCPRVPIVAVTANAMPGDRERCLDAGMDDHLQKPFTQTEFHALVEAWLKAPVNELA